MRPSRAAVTAYRMRKSLDRAAVIVASNTAAASSTRPAKMRAMA
jgi:hypothetical protein